MQAFITTINEIIPIETIKKTAPHARNYSAWQKYTVLIRVAIIVFRKTI